MGARKPITHATPSGYVRGCRCDGCRVAMRTYNQRRKAGELPLVLAPGVGTSRRNAWMTEAEPVRLHLAALSAAGVGYRAVAAAASVSDRTLLKVTTGRSRWVHPKTARAVLGVTADAHEDHGLMPAAESHRLLGLLRAEGYSMRRLSRELGMANYGHIIRKEKVTARKAHRIRKLYQQLTT